MKQPLRNGSSIATRGSARSFCMVDVKETATVLTPKKTALNVANLAMKVHYVEFIQL